MENFNKIKLFVKLINRLKVESDKLEFHEHLQNNSFNIFRKIFKKFSIHNS